MSPQGRAPPPGVRGGGATDPLPPTATRSRRRVPWGGCSSRSGTTGKNASWWPSSMPAGEATWWGGLRGGGLRAWTPPPPAELCVHPPQEAEGRVEGAAGPLRVPGAAARPQPQHQEEDQRAEEDPQPRLQREVGGRDGGGGTRRRLFAWLVLPSMAQYSPVSPGSSGMCPSRKPRGVSWKLTSSPPCPSCHGRRRCWGRYGGFWGGLGGSGGGSGGGPSEPLFSPRSIWTWHRWICRKGEHTGEWGLC